MSARTRSSHTLPVFPQTTAPSPLAPTVLPQARLTASMTMPGRTARVHLASFLEDRMSDGSGMQRHVASSPIV